MKNTDDTAASFRHNIAQTFARATSVQLYVDKVAVLLRDELLPDHAKKLHDMGHRHGVKLHPTRGQIRQEYAQCVVIPRPRSVPDLIAWLASAAGEHAISTAEIACDFHANTQDDAVQMEAFIIRHGVQKYHGKREMEKVGRMQQWAAKPGTRRRRARRDIKAYSDLPSPFTGGPVAHTETVFNTVSACGAVGLYGLPSLLRLTDADLAAIWTRTFKLECLDWPRAVQVIRRDIAKRIRADDTAPKPGKFIYRRTADQEWSRFAMIMRTWRDKPTKNTLHEQPVQIWRERMVPLIPALKRAIIVVPFNPLALARDVNAATCIKNSANTLIDNKTSSQIIPQSNSYLQRKPLRVPQIRPMPPTPMAKAPSIDNSNANGHVYNTEMRPKPIRQSRNS